MEEIRLNHWYRCASDWHDEPVIKKIYSLLSQDEARHGGVYLRYMKKYLKIYGVKAKLAFAKIGLLMTSSKKKLKSTSSYQPHVNEDLYPNDTVQSKLPSLAGLKIGLINKSNFLVIGRIRLLR